MPPNASVQATGKEDPQTVDMLSLGPMQTILVTALYANAEAADDEKHLKVIISTTFVDKQQSP